MIEIIEKLIDESSLSQEDKYICLHELYVTHRNNELLDIDTSTQTPKEVLLHGFIWNNTKCSELFEQIYLEL